MTRAGVRDVAVAARSCGQVVGFDGELGAPAPCHRRSRGRQQRLRQLFDIAYFLRDLDGLLRQLERAGRLVGEVEWPP